jgi:hypothetical protein
MQIYSTATVQPTTHCLLYGPSKCGKTRALATAPNPIICSTDDGLSSIRDKNLPFVDVRSWAQLLEFRKWLKGSAEAKQFQTICFDDLTEIAEQFLVAEKPQHKNLMQAYGRLNDEMMLFIRELRDIRGQNVIFTCKQDRIKDEITGGLIYSPMIPGKAVQPMLPYLVGEVYHMEQWVDPASKIAYEVFRTKRDPMNQYDAGSRSGRLSEIEFADFSAIFAKVMS